VQLTPAVDVWEETFEVKKKVYEHHMVSTGIQDNDPRSARKDEDIEPVFYCTLPEMYFSDLITSNNALGFLDLTPGQGEAARACLALKKPYLGLCMSDAHVSGLHKELVAWLLRQMCREGHALYDQKFATREGAKLKHGMDGKDGKVVQVGKVFKVGKVGKDVKDVKHGKRRAGGRRRRRSESESSGSSSPSQPRKVKKSKKLKEPSDSDDMST
jgi:hypothetical protein